MLVGFFHHFFPVNDQSASSFNHQRDGTGLNHRIDRVGANALNIKAHILLWFGRFCHRNTAPAQLSTATDTGIGALNRLDCHNRPVLYHHSLPNIQAANLLGHGQAKPHIG